MALILKVRVGFEILQFYKLPGEANATFWVVRGWITHKLVLIMLSYIFTVVS